MEPTHQVVRPAGIESQEHLGELGGAPRPATLMIPPAILMQEFAGFSETWTDQEITGAFMRSIRRVMQADAQADTILGP